MSRSARRGAGAVVVLLVAALALWTARAPRDWHVVVIEVPLDDAPSPRGDALFAAGVEGPGEVGDDLAEVRSRLVGAGWRDLGVARGPAREAVEQALGAAYDHGPAGGRALLEVRLSGADGDAALGRLVDGLAGPMRPDRTLFVLIRGERATLVAPARRSGSSKGGLAEQILEAARIPR